VPAKNDSSPVGVIFSITWLPLSATYTFPARSTAMPFGLATLELVAAPAAGGPMLPVPAKIDSTPPGVTFSISFGPVSAMYTSPELSTATPAGYHRAELVAVPGVGAPLVPRPATTDKSPPGVGPADATPAPARPPVSSTAAASPPATARRHPVRARRSGPGLNLGDDGDGWASAHSSL
jgi:hypothetical protein